MRPEAEVQYMQEVMGQIITEEGRHLLGLYHLPPPTQPTPFPSQNLSTGTLETLKSFAGSRTDLIQSPHSAGGKTDPQMSKCLKRVPQLVNDRAKGGSKSPGCGSDQGSPFTRFCSSLPLLVPSATLSSLRPAQVVSCDPGLHFPQES